VRTQMLSWAVYLIVCMGVPFVWGLLIHWVFSQVLERRRVVTPPQVREEAGRAVLDYHI
jgi:hypothetical protein